jgi:hypothetical protein
MFSNVKAKHEWNLQQTLKDSFVSDMVAEIVKRKVKVLRLHSSGDLYSQEYANKWIEIVKALPNVEFYAYTKSWHWFNNITIPSNFKVIQSQGGTMEIDKNKPHAIVFDDKNSIPENYSDASESDMVAIKNEKIALVYHGTKKMTLNGFINTNRV